MDYNKYFPEQYARNKHYVKKMIDKFQYLDFWEDYTGDFYEFLCSPTVNARKDVDLAESYISFYRNGRNIIEIPYFLSELLCFTDVGDVKWNDIKTPYETVYFHFSRNENTPNVILEKRSYLIGAYVTNKIVDHTRMLNFTLILEEYHGGVLNFSMECDTSKYIDNPTINESIIASVVWDDENYTYEYEYAGLKACVEDIYNDADTEINKMIYNSICLLVNCVCYLNSTEKDIKLYTTNEQATELLRQLEQAKKSQQRTKLTQKLSKLSYSKIHLLGESLQKKYERLIAEKEVEAHWRRGHWRNQPYGKGLMEAKLIWIKPTIVRKDKGSPVKGHIYN